MSLDDKSQTTYSQHLTCVPSFVPKHTTVKKATAEMFV